MIKGIVLKIEEGKLYRTNDYGDVITDWCRLCGECCSRNNIWFNGHSVTCELHKAFNTDGSNGNQEGH